MWSLDQYYSKRLNGNLHNFFYHSKKQKYILYLEHKGDRVSNQILIYYRSRPRIDALRLMCEIYCDNSLSSNMGVRFGPKVGQIGPK